MSPWQRSKAVEQLDFLGPESRVRRFQDQRDVIESGVIHDKSKGLDADGPLSQRGMAVHPGAQVLFGIIQVHGLQVAQPHDIIKGLHGRFETLWGSDVVAGAKGMTGIQADTDPVRIFYIGNDGRQVFEDKAHIAPLARGVLDNGAHATGFGKGHVDGFGNPGQAFFLIDFAQVAARMKVEVFKAQLFTPLHFINKGSPGFGQALGLGVPQINQVAVMGQDMIRRISRCRAVFF